MKFGNNDRRCDARNKFLEIFEMLCYSFVRCPAQAQSSQYSGNIIARAMTFP